MPRGGVAIAENTRFYPGEETNDAGLAARFAALGDLYVNDAFGSAHRAHASTEGGRAPAQAGGVGLPDGEGARVPRARRSTDPKRPFVAVMGGAKISGKIDLIEALLPKVDTILIGGAMACTFFKAMGLEIGNSLVEADRVELGRRRSWPGPGRSWCFPVARSWRRSSTARPRPGRCRATRSRRAGRCSTSTPPPSRDFAGRIAAAGTVVWNGPMGVFETPPFDHGTLAVAEAMARATAAGAITVVGGGDSAAAVAAGRARRSMTHVSTGGGASLEFLEGKVLPGVAALDES